MNLDDAHDLAYQVLSETGLTDEGWSFEFDQAERRLGSCHHRSRTITLSAPLSDMNDEDVVLETLLHEVAHARTPGSNHGYEFVMAARALGISGDACADAASVNVNVPPWKAHCPRCGEGPRRWRLTKKSQGLACARCCNEYNGGRYSSAYQFQWTKEG